MYVINPKTIASNILGEIRIALDKVQINCLFARAVLDYKVDGVIAVSSCSNAQLFYIRHPYGMSLLFGQTDNYKVLNQFWNWFKKEVTETEFLQIYPQTNVNFPNNIEAKQLERINFKFNKDRYFANKNSINAPLQLEKVTKPMFKTINGMVVPKNFWRNAEEFAKYSVGVSVLNENEPVSTSFAAFVHSNMLELGIETSYKHRGKNLAYACCSALIEYCLQHRFEPVWACRKDNVGSYKLALKLGFDPVLSIPYYEL